MSFVLKIFFAGLIALVPSRDGKELTVLLLDTQHRYVLSDGSVLPPHRPVLLARAGSCTGACAPGDTSLARFLFAGALGDPLENLHNALLDGTAWELAQSDLSIAQPAAGRAAPLDIRRDLRAKTGGRPAGLPRSPTEREDFSWVAELGKIDPTAAVVAPDVLAPRPRPGLLAARLHLRSGRVFTYRVLATPAGNLAQAHFQTLTGGHAVVAYSQALADWVEADVTIAGDHVDLIDQSFDGAHRRSVRLGPHAGSVEVALLNLGPHAKHDAGAPLTPGKHFEIFYELAKHPPAKTSRPVPFPAAPAAAPAAAGVPWSTVHPEAALWSDLLEAIQLGVPPRGTYDRTICALTQLQPGP